MLKPLLLATAALCLAAGSWAWWDERRQPDIGDWLVIDSPTMVARDLEVNQPKRFPLTFRNRNGRHVVRLLGSPNSCGPNGCYSVQPMPLTIAPGGQAELTVECKPFVAGQFDCDVIIYTDCPGQTEIHVSVHALVLPEPANGLLEEG